MLSVVITGTADPTRRVLHGQGDLDVDVTRIHDGLGVANGAMDVVVSTGRRRAARVEDARQAWRRVWWVLDDGRPVFAGIPTEHPDTPDTATVLRTTLARADVILTRRRVWSTMPFNTDQGFIVADLLRYATGVPVQHVDDLRYRPQVRLLEGALLPWLRITEQATGITRERGDNPDGYQGAVGKTISECINALAGVTDTKDGARRALGLPGAFDYHLAYGIDDDGLLYAEPRIGYPRLGSDKPLHFQYPGTISGFVEAVDATDAATGWRTVGGTTEARTVGEPAYDYEAFAAGWPLLQGQDTSSSVDDDVLLGHAEAELSRHSGDHQGFRYTLDPSQWHKIDLGDTLVPTIEHPQRWPGVKYPAAQRLVGLDLTFVGGVLVKLAPTLGDR